MIGLRQPHVLSMKLVLEMQEGTCCIISIVDQSSFYSVELLQCQSKGVLFTHIVMAAGHVRRKEH